MAKQSYSCIKCEGTEYRTGELRTTGSGITRFLNIQSQKYATVACAGCGYTELYRLDGSGIGNILDFFGN
ncbi:GTP-binding protein [SAR202 cluster bacterium AC-647-N09_OGT_505m]|nr:GTP-binding protein [SAR202 cluster bacterium AC-647-N09_OGT_505m]